MDNIEKLYQHYETLNEAKEQISQHEDKFSEIIQAVKGSANEKRLASQFIARFFKHFPKLSDTAMDAMLDLCEDDDVAIRKQAIKDLASLCKDSKEYVAKVSFALAQILQSDDNSEISIIHNSVASLFQIDALGTLAGLFSEIGDGDEIIRERTLKLLAMKLKTMGSSILTKEVQDYLISECKKVLQDVTADEFVLVMAILGQCKVADTVSGQQQLVELVAEQCNFSQPFNPADQENIDRIIICMKHGLPYFSTQVKSTAFVSYICDQVLPHRAGITSSEGVEQKLDFFKLLAELSTNCGALDDILSKIGRVYETLVEYMPLPPMDESNGTEENGENEPRFEFTYVESLMYAFHQLGRQCPEFLNDNAERLKDFRLRLQYFARGVQGYMKKLRESLHGKSAEQLKDDESRIKVTALRTTSNINTLIRDLFRSPPAFKASVTLSFKPAVTSQAAKTAAVAAAGGDVAADGEAAGTKRHAPITFESSPPKAQAQGRGGNRSNRGNWTPYSVPTGKFSAKVNHGHSEGTSRPRGGRGGYRGGRGFRRGGY